MKTFIIAEAGVNHNGSLEMALRLIDAAVQAGADAVKFQTFKSEELTTSKAPLADYQKEKLGEDGVQLDLLKGLELDRTDHEQLKAYCDQQGIEFMSTPFDLLSLDLLVGDLGIQRLKISSGDLTNGPLLFHAAHAKKPIILSTGMARLGEIEQALAVLSAGYIAYTPPSSFEDCMAAYASSYGQEMLQKNVVLLQCTTAYPTADDQINLRVMDTLQGAFGLAVGLSDHSMGTAVSIAAVARGAQIIEKHFTLDRSLPGPDHHASLEPDELALMVRGIRQVEAALGSGIKIPTEEESKNSAVARKSLVAARHISQGMLLDTTMLTAKRPGNGISPMHYWDWIGRPAPRDYKPDQTIVQFEKEI